MAPSRRRLSLTPESWDALFDFLDPTRPEKQGANRDAEAEDQVPGHRRASSRTFSPDAAAEMPKTLRWKRCCAWPGKCAGLSGAAFADCIAYFYGVARNVNHERVRGARRELTNREAAAKDPTLARAVDPD